MGNFLARLQGNKPDDNATPLPTSKVLMTALVIAANDLALVSVYPTLPFMVHFFLPELSPEELGRRAGLLGASFNLGQLFGSLLWGRLSDRFGRRPIMLIGLFGTVVSLTLFAFAVSFEMAVAARLAWGLLNANVGIAKSAVAESCNDSNQARALAMLSIGTGLARLVSPVIGGALALPATKWPDVFPPDGLFGQFPFLMPTLIGAAISVIALVSTILFLKETLVREPVPAAEEEDGVPLVVAGAAGKMAPPRTTPSRRKPLTERVVALQLLRSRKVVLSCVLYTLLGLCVSALSDVLPLWALLPLDGGGFAFDSTEMGLLVLAGAPVQILLQAFVFDRLVRRFGFLRTFQGSMTWVGAWVFFIPFVHELASNNVAATWAALSISWAAISSVWMMSFTSTFGFVNNSVLARHRGSANGLSQTMVALGRIVGPILGGNIFAWSVSGGHSWPIDYHFVFHLVGLMFLGTAALAFLLPRSIDRKLETVLAEEQAASLLHNQAPDGEIK